MKLLVLLILGTFAVVPSFARASQQTEIKTLRTVSFDGKTFDATYEAKGGCQAHTGAVILDYYSATDTYWVNVIDQTQDRDDCEGRIAGAVKIDLQSRITQMAQAGGRPAGARMKVVLPQVEL